MAFVRHLKEDRMQRTLDFMLDTCLDDHAIPIAAVVNSGYIQFEGIYGMEKKSLAVRVVSLAACASEIPRQFATVRSICGR